MSEILYQCRDCGRRISVKEGEAAPLCCHKEMEPLPSCTTVPNPEMARNYEIDEPCQDGSMPKSRK